MNSDKSFSNDPVNKVYTEPVIVEHHRSIWAPVLGIGLLAIAAFSFYQFSQVSDLRRELQDNKAETSAIQTQIAAQNSALAGTTNDLNAKLEDTEQKTTQSLAQSLAKVQDAAKRHADVVASNVQKTLEKKNADETDAINAELAGVKNSVSDTTSQMSSKIDGVGATVDSVKTDLESTKAVADKTAADLQRATGDMGVMSGLIATNGKEIQELRAMGDRNIFEFTISKKAGLQKVGDVQIRLTKTDPKHNRYTVTVMADDKLVEKKDKTANEPVQFYAAKGSRTPYEVVVNEVDKDTIRGYMATPKPLATARMQ
jgi:chromosome segregation ATPase